MLLWSWCCNRRRRWVKLGRSGQRIHLFDRLYSLSSLLPYYAGQIALMLVTDDRFLEFAKTALSR